MPHLNELDRLVSDAKARKEQATEHAGQQERVVYVDYVAFMIDDLKFGNSF